jgi:uncharacterized protein involved in exopolysaccharide biosynthesis
MEEYEVDLRDYLRVMWERKWLIVGVFTAALVAAAAYSYTLPDEYEAQALVELRNAPIPQDQASTSSPDPSLFKQLLQNVNPSVRVRDISRDTFQLTLRGRGPFQALVQQLTEAIKTVQNALRRQLQEEISQQIDVLQQLRRQQETQLSASQRALEEQLRAIAQAQQAAGPLSLAAQAQMIALMSRLQAFYEEQQDVQRSVQLLALYQELLGEGWSPVRVVYGPQGSPSPVGPPRQLNVAIAGVLGLFVGILLAFFVHYLQSEPSSAPPSKA